MLGGKAKREYLRAIYERYRAAGRKAKHAILPHVRRPAPPPPNAATHFVVAGL